MGLPGGGLTYSHSHYGLGSCWARGGASATCPPGRSLLLTWFSGLS